jgi:para-nitrobenzyl esterase
MAEYLTALLRARSVDAVADILCRQQPQSIYCYLFTWNELAPAPWLDNLLLGATHALEVPFVFGHRNLGPEFLSIPLIEQKSFDGFDYLSRVIMSYWAEFSYTGRPERGRSEELPPWHSWDTSDCARNFILLDLESRDGLSMSSQNFITEAILYRLKTDPRFENIYDRNSFFFDLTKIAAAFALLDATDYAPFPDG